MFKRGFGKKLNISPYCLWLMIVGLNNNLKLLAPRNTISIFV